MSVASDCLARPSRRPTDPVSPFRLEHDAVELASRDVTVAAAVAAALDEAGRTDDSRAVTAAGAALKTATREQLVVAARGKASSQLLAEMSLSGISTENARVLAAAEWQERQAAVRSDLHRPTRWERYGVPAGGWIVAIVAAAIALLK